MSGVFQSLLFVKFIHIVECSCLVYYDYTTWNCRFFLWGIWPARKIDTKVLRTKRFHQILSLCQEAHRPRAVQETHRPRAILFIIKPHPKAAHRQGLPKLTKKRNSENSQAPFRTTQMKVSLSQAPVTSPLEISLLAVSTTWDTLVRLFTCSWLFSPKKLLSPKEEYLRLPGFHATSST